jgi:hypothetical protein
MWAPATIGPLQGAGQFSGQFQRPGFLGGVAGEADQYVGRAGVTAHLPDLRTIINGPDGQMRLTSILTYLMTVNIGELTENDLQPVIGQLGPPAQEVVMTIAERLEARGEAQGRAETLLELLAVKFGPLPARVTATVQSADLPQLREWTTRVLTANNLDDLFTV